MIRSVVQAKLRATKLIMRPSHQHSTLLLAQNAPGTARMREVMSSVLQAILGPSLR